MEYQLLISFDNNFQESSYTLEAHTYTLRGRRGHDRMIVGFMTTYAISACHH